MKESDAKNKWCPFAFSEGMLYKATSGLGVALAVASINRTPKTGKALSECKCIVGECMAWVPSGKPSEGFCSLMDDNVNGR